MDKWKEMIWQRFFGSVWAKLVETDPDIGGFVVLHETKEVKADKNACRILGLNAAPSYDAFCNLLSGMDSYAAGRAPVMIRYAERTGEIAAGFICLDRSHTEFEHTNLRLCPPAQLYSAMNGDGGDSMLMLVKLKGINSDMSERSCYIFSAVSALSAVLPDEVLVSEHADDELWIYYPRFEGDAIAFADKLSAAVAACKLTDEVGSVISEHHNMTLSAGICISKIDAAYKMHAAAFALYEADESEADGAVVFSEEQYQLQKSEYNDLVKISRLIDQNLFSYHFQPIVSARTGEIVAYEALMRTDDSIALGPLEILEMAQRYGRLYDIELATVANTMALLSENQSFFENRRMFINAITSHLLNEDDFGSIVAAYGELMEKVVVEFTEQTEINDERLSYIKKRLGDAGMGLAIDDYGTGYSNTSNLVRYKPEIVKIDRSIIAGIDSNPKMQQLVRGIIEFIHSSGMIALGEGVETIDEIRTLIYMDIDLLQGYYVSRPKPVLINEISENIRKEIVTINLEATGQIRKLYRANDGDRLDLRELALEKYTDIFVGEGRYYISGGNAEQAVRMAFTVADDAECELVFSSINIEPDPEIPAIKLGSGSKLRIVLEGSSRIEHSCILVPESAALRISGSGDLFVAPEAQECFAIGNVPDAGFGDIDIDLDGRLTLNVNGENCAAIGGGRGGAINITAGTISINCTSGTCIGIGAYTGESRVNLSDCAFEMTASAANAVCIGSISGDAYVKMRNIAANCSGSGNKLCGIGSMSGGYAAIRINNTQLSTSMKGKTITSVGTSGGKTNCRIENAKLELYAEGGTVLGIGDKTGGGSVVINEAEVDITFLTGDGFAIGSPNGTLEFNNAIRRIRVNE